MYVLVFAVVTAVSVAAPSMARPACVVLGVTVALCGCCLAGNVLGMADQAAEKARAKPGTPSAFGSVKVVRLLALTLVAGGIGFVVQALLVIGR